MSALNNTTVWQDLNKTVDSYHLKDNTLTADLIAFYFFYTLIGFLTLMVNSFILFMMWKFEFLRTATNLCLACLAGSDFLGGFLATPLVIRCTVRYSFDVCLLMDLTHRFIAVSTIMHLLIVALERYLMICHPMIYPNIVTKPRVFAVIAGVWFLALIASIIQLSWILPAQERFTSEDLRKMEVTYDLIWVFTLLCFPLLIMLFAYTRILLVVRKQLQDIAKQFGQVYGNDHFKTKKRERKAILIYGTMVVLFSVTWFSYILSALAYDFGITVIIPNKLMNFLAILRHSTGLCNPLLYTFLKGDFKKGARLLFKKHERYRNRSLYTLETNMSVQYKSNV